MVILHPIPAFRSGVVLMNAAGRFDAGSAMVSPVATPAQRSLWAGLQDTAGVFLKRRAIYLSFLVARDPRRIRSVLKQVCEQAARGALGSAAVAAAWFKRGRCRVPRSTLLALPTTCGMPIQRQPAVQGTSLLALSGKRIHKSSSSSRIGVCGR